MAHPTPVVAQYYIKLPITVTRTGLYGNTRRHPVKSFFGWDSQEMERVMNALDAFHSGPSLDTQNELALAFYDWKTRCRAEYRNRDQISGGMVTKLAIELGHDRGNTDVMPSVLLEHVQVTNPRHRHVPRVIPSDQSVTTRMVSLKSAGRHLGVVLIDVESEDCGVKKMYDGRTSVLEWMKQVLKFAETWNVPVYEFWMRKTSDGGSATIQSLASAMPRTRQKECKPTHNSLEGTGLKAWLQSTPVDVAVVMGYNANQCVGSTIFGRYDRGSYNPGLLDIGCDVLTSRHVLASGDAPLTVNEGWPYLGPCRMT